MDANERRKRASREAADWWALLQGDDMTKAERESFIDWLRDSQTNIAEMLRLSQVHGALEQFREWADIGTDRSLADRQGKVVTLPIASPPSPFHRMERSAAKWAGEKPDQGGKSLRAGLKMAQGRGTRLIAFAATLAALAVVTAFIVPQFRGQWISTERGERREVVLDDGSVMQIDPQTKLNVRFDSSQRRIVLSQGRAVFRVARNLQRPFQVEAGGTTVRALGTAFGVDRRASDLVVVTVSEGKVAVTSPTILDPHAKTFVREAPKPSSSSPLPQRERQGEVVLTANEQITVAMTRATPSVRPVDSLRELAWADGRLVFNNDTVASVIAEFNRYNRVQLTVTDPALAARSVTAVFDAANPEGFIAFLQNAATVHIERDERSIVISPSERH